MRRLTSFFAALLLAFSFFSLTAFAEIPELTSSEEYYTRFRDAGISINVYNWGEYISDGSDDSLDINAEFEALTGIKVYYSTFATNEELYSKLRGSNSAYDVIIPSDYMIGKMITENMLSPLDFGNIPNHRQIDAKFARPRYDPQNLYSVPYTWGYVGIIYNKNMIFEDEIDSWNILWDEKYLGNILMFSNPRDAFAIAQSRLGYSMNTTDAAQLKDCLEELKKQKPLVQAYVMDEVFDKMLGGEAALAPYYAGDARTMTRENENLGFVLPKEGANLFVDAMCIPKGARQKAAAEMYINFMCEPYVGLANTEYIGYSSPNSGTLELMDPETANDEIMYPPDEILAALESFGELPRETSLLIDRLWTELLSSDDQYNRLLMPVLLFISILAMISINIIRGIRKKNAQKYSQYKYLPL